MIEVLRKTGGYATSLTAGLSLCALIEKGHIHRVEDNPPLWFREQFEEAFNRLPEQ